MKKKVAKDRERKKAAAATLFGIFSLIGLLLSAVGVCGVVAYMASQRVREIGIRMAMGARRGDIQRLIVRQGSRIAALGLGLGLIASAAVTRTLGAILYGISATDFATFFVVSAFLAAVALFASYIPARRASQLDPQAALRRE